MKGYWAGVVWLAASVLVIDAGWGIQRYSDKESRASFQAEFGIAYPSTPVQTEIAKAVVSAHIDALYQKQLASWNQYAALDAQYEPIRDVPTPSVKEAQAKLALSQEVDKASAAHVADFERLGVSCRVLYDDYHENRDDLHDKYPELSIPRQSACIYYFSPNSN